MKTKIIILIVLAFSELLTFARWSSCWLFQSNFYFTLQNLSTQLLISSNEEKGLPILLIRALHNKVTGLVWGIIVTFFQYIDIRFLEELLGIAGGVGVYLGFWYFAKKMPRNKILWVGVVLLFIVSFIEMIVIPHIGFSKRIIPLTLLLSGFSLFGVWQFLEYGNTRMRLSIIVILLVISFFALVVFPHSLYLFCLKV